MSSRKRAKGKDRKAKQAHLKLENQRAEKRAEMRILWNKWVRGESLGSDDYIQCNHGSTVTLTNDHPLCSFMDTFYYNWRNSTNECNHSKAIRGNLMDTFEAYPQVWNNERLRKAAISIFTRIGTNLLLGTKNILLGSDSTIIDIDVSIETASAIVVLENYDGLGDIVAAMNSRSAFTKMRDLLGGHLESKRDVLKFYRKRISCSCLKEMHLGARKTFPIKLGQCQFCGEQKKRSLLMVCSRCRCSHYCSRYCQIEDWHVHKFRCVCHL